MSGGDFSNWSNEPVHEAPKTESDIYRAEWKRYERSKRLFWGMFWVSVVSLIVLWALGVL